MYVFRTSMHRRKIFKILVTRTRRRTLKREKKNRWQWAFDFHVVVVDTRKSTVLHFPEKRKVRFWQRKNKSFDEIVKILFQSSYELKLVKNDLAIYHRSRIDSSASFWHILYTSTISQNFCYLKKCIGETEKHIFILNVQFCLFLFFSVEQRRMI